MTESKRIIKAASDPFPPYQYYNTEGKLVGIDCKVVKEVLESAGYQVEIILDEWGKVNEMLKNKELDALFQVAPTPERLARCYFSQPYRYAVTEIITADPQLEIVSYEHLLAQGLKLAVIGGYVYGDAIDVLPKEIKVCYPDISQELLAVSNGEVALGVFDQGARIFECEVSNITNMQAIKSLSFNRPMYVMFNDQEVCSEFDIALKRHIK